MDALYQLSQKFLQARNQVYRRYFIQKTNLSERMSILIGQRGVGKTTLLVQYLLDYVEGDLFSKKILYVPSDHIFLANTNIYLIAEEFIKNGGEYIAFDEIHKAESWSQLLKSIYDTFPKLKILASGSSALEIHKGSHDLSRRALVYSVFGLSFREYLEMRLNMQFSSISLEEIIINHQSFAHSLVASLEKMNLKIIPFFRDYLRHGFYPYWFEFLEEAKFEITLEQNIHTTLESDLISIYPNLSGSSIKKIRLLLTFIAQNAPYAPSWKELTELLNIGDERTLKNYFSLLEDAGLISFLYKSSKKIRAIESPSKIYLQNTNLCYAIGNGKENIGTIREIFILNMLYKTYNVTLPLAGDFLIDGNIVFEVGGRKKNKAQIWQEKNAYIVCDDIEIGIADKIPLWIFGFIY